jgi:hypothetical protein
MKKTIDYQNTEKMEKVKDTLEKKIQYIEFGLNYEHLQLTVGRFLKTRQKEWMLVHQKGMGWLVVFSFVFSNVVYLIVKVGRGQGD